MNTPSADGCNYDAQGNPNCAVQSQGAKDSLIDLSSIPGESAETSPQQKVERTKNPQLPEMTFEDFLKRIDLKEAESKARERTKKKDCKDFLEGFNKDALKILDANSDAVKIRIGSRYGGYFGNSNSFSNADKVAVTVSNLDNNSKRLASGTIYFNSFSVFFTQRLANGNLLQGYSGLSFDEFKQLVIIHEWIHILDIAGKHNDKDVSNTPLNKEIIKNCF